MTALALRTALARMLFLSREPRLHSMRRFQEACLAGGHALSSLDVLAATLVVAPKGPQLWWEGAPIGAADIDVVVPRIGTTVTQAGCMVLHHLETMGVPCVNGSQAIMDARDKLRALQVLGKRGVAVPATAVTRSTVDLDDALQAVGGVPCVVKLLAGTQGIGVMLAESREGLEAMLQAFWSLGHTVLLQQFVSESRGRDVRAFVVGGEVVAAMRRQAQYGEFRSNIHRGGQGHPVQLDGPTRQAVLEAAAALRLEVAGVDYVEAHDGPKVLEVNASPGFQGLEEATGADVAGAVVAHAARVARGGA